MCSYIPEFFSNVHCTRHDKFPVCGYLCMCMFSIYKCIYYKLPDVPLPLPLPLLLLPLQFLQNNKLRANNAASNGNKLKNKQKSKCTATILNNKCAEPTPFWEEEVATMQNEGDRECPVEKCIARVQCKKKCSQRLPAAASATKQRLRCHRCEASSPTCHMLS